MIAPHLAAFARSFPELWIEPGLGDGISEIVGEGFDLGIRPGERCRGT